MLTDEGGPGGCKRAMVEHRDTALRHFVLQHRHAVLALDLGSRHAQHVHTIRRRLNLQPCSLSHSSCPAPHCTLTMLYAARNSNPTCSVVFIASTGISTMRNAAADADATAVLTPTYTASILRLTQRCHEVMMEEAADMHLACSPHKPPASGPALACLAVHHHISGTLSNHRQCAGGIVAVQHGQRAGVGSGVTKAAHGSLDQCRPHAPVESADTSILQRNMPIAEQSVKHGLHQADSAGGLAACSMQERTAYSVLNALVMVPPFRYW